MITKKEVSERLQRVTNFRNILETYEEIAASRMQNARKSVLSGRNFIEQINYIFQQVKTSYRNEVEMKVKNKKGSNKFSFIQKSGKSVVILLSSNTGLYGDLIRKTCDLFINVLKNEKMDAVIIGRTGLEIFKNANMLITYNYFDFPDDKIDDKELKEIATYILKYEKIFVVYGKFENVITQDPVVTNITGDIPAKEDKVRVKYFFEPNLEKILEFFEAEIFSSLFEQTIFESQLAKFASRMTSLELRVENIKDLLKIINLEKQRIKHRTLNKKQLETFSTMSLWTKI